MTAPEYRQLVSVSFPWAAPESTQDWTPKGSQKGKGDKTGTRHVATGENSF